MRVVHPSRQFTDSQGRASRPWPPLTSLEPRHTPKGNGMSRSTQGAHKPKGHGRPARSKRCHAPLFADSRYSSGSAHSVRPRVNKKPFGRFHSKLRRPGPTKDGRWNDQRQTAQDTCATADWCFIRAARRGSVIGHSTGWCSTYTQTGRAIFSLRF